MKIILDVPIKYSAARIASEIMDRNDHVEGLSYNIIGSNSIIIDIEELVPEIAEKVEDNIKYILEEWNIVARIESSLTGNTTTTQRKKPIVISSDRIESLKKKSRELTRQGEIVEATRLFNKARNLEHIIEDIGEQYTLLAAQIIDTVEDAIYDEHPDLADQMIEKYEEDIEDPSIISGDAYYELEDKIVKLLSR